VPVVEGKKRVDDAKGSTERERDDKRIKKFLIEIVAMGEKKT
jgi:hypothetical protein